MDEEFYVPTRLSLIENGSIIPPLEPRYRHAASNDSSKLPQSPGRRRRKVTTGADGGPRPALLLLLSFFLSFGVNTRLFFSP